MNSYFLFLFFAVNLSPVFTFLKWERKKIDLREIKKNLVQEIVSKKDWKFLSKMEDIVYQRDIENFLYGFSKDKVYQIKKKKAINLYFPIKSLELAGGRKDFYLVAIGDKELALLNKNLDILYYKEFNEKIKEYIIEDRNFDGEDEIYLIFKNKILVLFLQKEVDWELKDNWLIPKWFVGDRSLLYLLFPDSIVILDKNLKTKKIYPKKKEKFVLLTLKRNGLVIISKLEDRSILVYEKNKKIEIFGNFDTVESKIFKDGFLIKADNNLFFVNSNLSYFEKINENYPIKEIKDYKILDVNNDKKEDLLVSDGDYLFYFLNNLLILEEMQRDYYQKLTNRIKRGNLYDYQDLLITLLNLTAQVGLPFSEFEKKITKMIKKYYIAKIQQQLLLSSFLSVSFVLFVLLFIRPIFLKIRNKKWYLENRSLPQIIRIASDFIALNHNYLIKGNFSGAQNRIKKIYEDCKLVEEEVLYLKETLEQKFFMENYLSLLKKILNNKNIVNLTEFLQEINQSLAKKMEFQKINSFQIANYLKREGYYLLEIYDPFVSEESYKIFLDRKLENFLIHLIVDHLKYAKKKAIIVLEKKVITDWQKKIIFHFYSDADTEIDFKKGHLAEEIKEIKENYFDYLEIRGGFQSQEKVILIFSDLIGIIEEIIKKAKI